MNQEAKSKIVTDSIILIFIRIVTMSVSIIQAMIIARTLTKEDYGTYSQGLLVITFLAPLVSLGLENAINYFYNKSIREIEKKDYINTIFFITILSGIICAIGIIICGKGIAHYFDNPAILGIITYISFRPCLQNLIALYQPLFISAGYTKIIAIRNLIISLLQISIVGGIALVSENVVLMFFLLLCMDILQLITFAIIYKKKCFYVNVFKPQKKCINEIISYSIPMFISLSIGTISINLDKLMIAGMLSPTEYALYSNMAKELPFAFIAASFTAVISPYIIRYLNSGEKNKFVILWKKYLEIGYKLTWPFCVAAIILAPELIEVLYSQRYLTNDGISVFQLYCIVAMMRFTYFGIVCSAVGMTKIILKYSIISCLINICLNYPMYFFFGMSGPALATVISMVISGILYFRKSVKIVDIKIGNVLSLKDIIVLFIEMIFTGIIIKLVFDYFEIAIPNIFISFTIQYILIVGIIYLINARRLISIFRSINKDY